MKICNKCGIESVDEAVVCPNCGCVFEYKKQCKYKFQTATKIFMIIGLVYTSIIGFLIPLAWCIPMYIHYTNSVKRNEPIGNAFKICILLFVNMIAGILMFCEKDETVN